MTKILIKRGQAEANLPTLDPGEPAVTFDSGGKLWIGTPSGNLEITGGGGGSPGAPNGSVQFNDGGSLGGSANFLWSDSDNQLLVGGPTPVSANSVLEAHDSYVNTIFILANDTASAELNTAAMGFYLKNSAEAQTPFAGFEVGSADLTDGSEDGYFTIATMFEGTSTPLFRLDPTAINLNYLGRDTDTIIQGNTATKLGVFDAGLDAFQIGTTTAGVIADFRSTGIVINEDGADRDFRIESDTNSAMFFVDASVNQVLIGTSTADTTFTSTNLVVRNDAGLPLLLRRDATTTPSPMTMYNADTTDGNGLAFAFATNTTGSGAANGQQLVQLRGVFNTHDHATRSASMQFFTVQSGAGAVRMILGTGLQVGSPTGGDKGAGTINTAGDIYKNNTAYTSPDYVFEKYFTGTIEKYAKNDGAENYKFTPLNDLKSYVAKTMHLPTRPTGEIGIFERADWVQEKLEELAIYIIELHERIEVLEKGMV